MILKVKHVETEHPIQINCTYSFRTCVQPLPCAGTLLTGVRVANRAIFSDSVDFTFFWNFVLQNSLSRAFDGLLFGTAFRIGRIFFSFPL